MFEVDLVPSHVTVETTPRELGGGGGRGGSD